jgi:pimeloyl-ACP methyl ester carboxylesterase
MVFAAAVVVLLRDDAPAPAQGNEFETVITADGVQLTGQFQKAKNGGNNDPVVILMYPPGVDRNMDKGEWKSLANFLTEQGYHVFRFDWRGHGKSNILKGRTFWENAWTGPANKKLIKGSAKMPGMINVKDFNPAYFPLYVNDLAAVRAHLDQKNDAGDLNTSSVYLIGSDEAATLGIFWLAAEWSRPAVYTATPVAPNGYEVLPDGRFANVRDNPTTAAGATYAGCVWLTANRPQSIHAQTARDWTKTYAQALRDNNPMLFLYGDKDSQGKSRSEEYYKEVLLAAPPKGSSVKPLEQTFIRAVNGAGQLKGAALLGNNVKLGTEDTIVKYLSALQKERAKVARKQRMYNAPYFVDLASFGVRLP